VVSPKSNGDGFLLVMDTAFMAFVMKVEVFLVLMQVAVVGVDDGGVVSVDVVNGGVDVVDGGVGF